MRRIVLNAPERKQRMLDAIAQLADHLGGHVRRVRLLLLELDDLADDDPRDRPSVPALEEPQA